MLVSFVITGGDASELGLVPTAFVAVTVNVYAVFWVNPVIVTEVLAVVAITSPGSDVTVYSVIGLPPSEAGAVHETVASLSPGVADKLVGASGTPVVVTALEGAELALVPAALVAVTVKV